MKTMKLKIKTLLSLLFLGLLFTACTDNESTEPSLDDSTSKFKSTA